ncbi:AmmeMemoRadiSam system radical SAM enzyme, partial [Thermoproteota archaeon]
AMCRWLKENVGENVPLHFSRFFPHYKMKDLPPTPVVTLQAAMEISKKYMNYVYLGNMASEAGENTHCPKCGKLLIGRSGFGILINKIKDGKCPCGHKIAGRWS